MKNPLVLIYEQQVGPSVSRIEEVEPTLMPELTLLEQRKEDHAPPVVNASPP